MRFFFPSMKKWFASVACDMTARETGLGGNELSDKDALWDLSTVL